MQKKRDTKYLRRGKRMLDLLIAIPGLALLSPVLVLLALLVRVFHGSPLLFCQTRSGKDQRPFTILKFRTMTNARDQRGEFLPDSQRITRFGRFLRATSLDELPELWNVIIGEMSLVGPRPLLPRYDTFYSEREMARFGILPGITGWAQINGRNDLPWDGRLEFDVWYTENVSLGIDLRVLFLTIFKVLRRDNVQADPGQATFGPLDDERRARVAIMAETLNGAGRGSMP